MTNGIVGKETSQTAGSGLYFQTYQKLLRQRERIDREILKMQGRFFKAISKSKGVVTGHKKYVPRLKNSTTLACAIRKCMIPNREMNMQDVLKTLIKKDLYHTNSDSFYTMVNNKLNRDKLIKKVSRGIFVYSPRVKKERAVA